jgi:hypothetical protein
MASFRTAPSSDVVGDFRGYDYSMTIREHFRKRFTRMKNWFVVGAAIVGVVFSVWRYPQHAHQSPLQFGVYAVLGMLLGLVWVWLLRGRFLCPGCGTDLQKRNAERFRQERRERGWLNADRRLFWEAWDACPRCGRSFDDPYP